MTPRIPHPRWSDRIGVSAAGVVFREVETGAMLLSTADQVCLGLDQVGPRVWRLLPPVHNGLDALCDDLLRQYPEGAPEILQDDAADRLAPPPIRLFL